MPREELQKTVERVNVSCLHGSNDPFQFVNNFFGSHAVGCNFDRVFGFQQTADWPRRIAPIALVLLRQHLVNGNLLATKFKIACAAASSLFGTGREKNLALGIWKRNRSLVPAFADKVVLAGNLALPLHKVLARRWIVGNQVNHRCDFDGANLIRHVISVEQHAIVFKVDQDLACQRGDDCIVVPIDVGSNSRQRDGAVHRAGVKKAKAKPRRERSGNVTLSCACGAVDGYDHAMNCAKSKPRFYFNPLVAGKF